MKFLGSATYIVWLLACAGPILVLQWVFFGRYLRPRIVPIAGSTLMVGAFLSGADGFAIADKVWEFSSELTLGIRVGPVPLEEILFFFLTSLLVAQTMALFGARRASGCFDQSATSPESRV